MKTLNKIKLLDAMNDRHGLMTNLYRLSRPEHYSAYLLLTQEKGKDYNTGEEIVTEWATDIRGVSLFVTTNPANMSEFLENYKLDSK